MAASPELRVRARQCCCFRALICRKIKQFVEELYAITGCHEINMRICKGFIIYVLRSHNWVK
jgi:hypothetical protein